MTRLSNHGTLLAGPPAADPFVWTPKRPRTGVIGYPLTPHVAHVFTKHPHCNRLGSQGWIAFGRGSRAARLKSESNAICSSHNRATSRPLPILSTVAWGSQRAHHITVNPIE
jgi:hypothetical protein